MRNEPETAYAGAVERHAPIGAPRGVLLEPGRNCWRIARASRVAFLIDGDAYFGAVRSALAQARHSIFILGWDIDSRMRLVPDGADDGWPEPLGEFLNAIVSSRHDLHAYVLSWDFAMLYALEREWLPIYKLDWRTHRRLSFRLDDRHPTGASHHQKVIVVDDRVAFVSGYDLTRARWDTSTHAAADPRRMTAPCVPYPPFHDVGIVVEGDCARALSELARERWRRATDREPRTDATPDARSPWPERVGAMLTDVDIAIARTEPAFAGRSPVREVRALTLDAIEAARDIVFAENQYFTSTTIADAFRRSLAAARGPEIAVVSPCMQSGWLEIGTMGVLRARIHRDLCAADPHRRYRLYYPVLPWLANGDACLNVHSKVLVVDDEMLMIGSANFSNLSLGLDTECNLAITARGDPRVRAAIASLRNRLLAEHLDCGLPEVADAIAREGGIHGAIAALAWRFTPLHDWLSLDRIVVAAEALETNPYAPLIVFAAYLVGGVVVFPLTLLIGATAIVFGPLAATIYALAGALMSAMLVYAIGRRLGRETVRRLAGHRLNDLSQRLARRGLFAIVLVRLVPIAPYSIVNVVAGAAHIGWRDFLLGTLIGLMPGIVLISLFVDRAAAAIREPGPTTFALLTAIAGLLVAVAYMVNRKLGARATPSAVTSADHGG